MGGKRSSSRGRTRQRKIFFLRKGEEEIFFSRGENRGGKEKEKNERKGNSLSKDKEETFFGKMERYRERRKNRSRARREREKRRIDQCKRDLTGIRCCHSYNSA